MRSDSAGSTEHYVECPTMIGRNGLMLAHIGKCHPVRPGEPPFEHVIIAEIGR